MINTDPREADWVGRLRVFLEVLGRKYQATLRPNEAGHFSSSSLVSD